MQKRPIRQDLPYAWGNAILNTPSPFATHPFLLWFLLLSTLGRGGREWRKQTLDLLGRLQCVPERLTARLSQHTFRVCVRCVANACIRCIALFDASWSTGQLCHPAPLGALHLRRRLLLFIILVCCLFFTPTSCLQDSLASEEGQQHQQVIKRSAYRCFPSQ